MLNMNPRLQMLLKLSKKCQYSLASNFELITLRNVSYNSAPSKPTLHRKTWIIVTITASCLGSLAFYNYLKAQEKHSNVQNAEKKIKIDLPTYTKLQVKEHEKDLWITYGNGIYDLKDYASKHPGGEEMILMAAGSDLEFFWEQYKFHKKSEIIELLESMRIGNLKEEVSSQKNSIRCKPLKNIPKISLNDYRLEVAIEGKTLKSMQLNDLKNYPKYYIMSSIPCKSDPDKKGQTWSGAQLRDILRTLDISQFTSLRFECLDTSKSGKPYGSTLSIDQILNDPNFDVLLAYEMNDTDITPEHGYPIRVVMPQLSGSKNVKWLSRIVLLKNEPDK